MKLTPIEKLIIVAIVILAGVIASNLLYGVKTVPAGPTVVQIKVPSEFLASGFQKSNYVVGTYRGLPAVYDVMRDEVRVVQPSTTGTLVLAEDTKGGV